MSMTLLDRAADAVNAEIKRQLAGQPIPGVPEQPGTWTATGNSIDLRLCVLAAAKVLLSEPLSQDEVLAVILRDRRNGEEMYPGIYRVISEQRLASLTGAGNG